VVSLFRPTLYSPVFLSLLGNGDKRQQHPSPQESDGGQRKDKVLQVGIINGI